MTHRILLAALVAAGLGMSVAPASAATCFQLWYQRNAIYDKYDYCFQTAMARQYFGTACSTSNPQMSSKDWNKVANIRAQEKAKGCHVNQ